MRPNCYLERLSSCQIFLRLCNTPCSWTLKRISCAGACKAWKLLSWRLIVQPHLCWINVSLGGCCTHSLLACHAAHCFLCALTVWPTCMMAPLFDWRQSFIPHCVIAATRWCSQSRNVCALNLCMQRWPHNHAWPRARKRHPLGLKITTTRRTLCGVWMRGTR